jgi:sugar phosphate permease
MSTISDLKKAKRYRYLICLIIFSCYVLVYFQRLCPAVIALDMQESFKASGALLGVLSSAYFFPYAIMQLPTGLLVDSWGPRKTVSTFLLLAAGGSVLMGLAPSLGLAILGRVLVGAGVSTIFVSNFKLLAEWFDSRKFVIMGGIFTAMGGIGALSSSAPLAWASNFMGWRTTLVCMGIASAVMATLVCAFVRNRPSEKGWPSMYPGVEDEPETEIGLLRGMKQVVVAGRFWPVAVWSFCACGVFFALGGLWGGPYLIHVYGLSKTAAGGILAMLAIALIVASPLLSFISNLVGRKPVFIGCSLLLSAVCAIFYLFPDSLPPAMLYVLFFCLSLGSGALGQLMATVTKELFPRAIAGTSVGTVNLFPFFGGAVFQITIGVIVASSGHIGGVYSLVGYAHMFLFCLIGSLICLGAAVLLRETLRQACDSTL